MPFFVTERKRSEAALIQVVREAFVQGVSTRKIEKLARSLGIENLSPSQVSEMTRGLNGQVEAFRNRSLSQHLYPILWVDALYEKVRIDGRIVSMAVLVVCGVDEHGQRDILAVEPMNYCSLTIQGSGSLTVTVPDRKYGIADLAYSDTAGGTLTIKDGAKITTNGGVMGLEAKTIVIESGNLNLNSGYGIATASLTMKGGILYTTGKYGAITNSWGKTRNIDSSLTVLYSEQQNAEIENMTDGTADDTTREGEVKTIYIAKLPPRAKLTVGAQQGTLQESLGSQTATFSVTGGNVKMDTLQVAWEGAHPGLTAKKSSDNRTITVTADNTVKAGSYKLKLTADSEAGFSPSTAAATATVTVAAAPVAPKDPITINKQPQVVYEKLDGESIAVVEVNVSPVDDLPGKITYQWYVNGKEFTGRGSGGDEIFLTKSDLTPVEGRNWEYSGQVYCKLSHKDYTKYTVNTDTVTVVINTCTHEKYTHDGKCRQCGEPCNKNTLFIRESGFYYVANLSVYEDGIPLGGEMVSGETLYFVRDVDIPLKAGYPDTSFNKDATLDMQGHKIKELDLENFPYKSFTIKNSTIGDIRTGVPAVLILDGVTTGKNAFSDSYTLTVKGDCVFPNQMTFSGKTQLRGGTFQKGINVQTGAPALALLADGYAFADADDSEILNVSDVSIKSRSVKVVEHTCQYQNGKCVCGRSCDHAGKVDKDGYCTFCKALVEAFEIGGKRYTSLEKALDAAQDDDTITLRGPLAIENAEPIEISKNIVLNLNGFTLSKSAENALLCILGSDVAIMNGKVQNTYTSKPHNAVEVGKLIVVTVQKANIGASLITPPTAQENLTYTGQEQALITAGSVANHGTMQYSLTENGTYSQDIPTGTDAGKYTVWYRVIGDANHNDTVPASVVVSIGKKPLTITGVTAASKPYDGTTNAGITSVTFDNVTLNRGTDYTVTASFDEASVGNSRSITATVTLTEQAAKNYALEQSSFTTTGSIIKAAAPDFTRETALVIINGYEKTYTVTLPALPTLETPKEYGALTYEISEIKLDGGYYTGGAKVENGKLTLPIQKNDVETTGSVGTATVVIKSTNYEDITLTVNVNATNKLVPTVTAPAANALTYNGAEQALVTAGKTTGGTMLYRLDDSEWSEQIPTAKNAGEYTVWYKVQGNAEYADVAEQSLTVTVAKKAVTVTVLDKSAYTGSTAPDLSSPEADKDYKVEGLVGADTLSGTVTLAYAQTPDMSKTGETAINITGTLLNDN